MLERLKRSATILMIGVFFVLLWLPLADSVFHLDRSPMLNEKRQLAGFPAWAAGFSGLRGFLSGLDAYHRDHFGFRRPLIRLGQKLKSRLFRESAFSDVMIGRDGWLYLVDARMIERYRGLDLFTPEDLRNWQSLLERRRDWLAARGIKYLFVIPPDKQSVYPEYLPDWMTPAGSVTKLDQFVAYLKAHSTVEVLDLRPVLREAKRARRTYLFTDTHWNDYGSFVGYQALIRALARQLPGLGEPLSLDDFEEHSREWKDGDLSNLLGQSQTMPEKDFVELVPRPPRSALELHTDDSIYPNQWKTGTLPSYTENPAQKYNILLFRDSFAHGWTPFVGFNFKRAVFIWQYHWNAPVIEREKPDVVVDEVVERFVCQLDPRQLLQEDELK